MLKKILNRKGQNTAEYAILISLVIAGIIAMQTYAQRALQSRVRDSSQFMVLKTNEIGESDQYEPYYLEKSMTVTSDSTDYTELVDERTTLDNVATVDRTGTRTDNYEGFGNIVGH